MQKLLIFILYSFFGLFSFSYADPLRNSEEFGNSHKKKTLGWEKYTSSKSKGEGFIWKEIQNKEENFFKEESVISQRESILDVRSIGRAVTINGRPYPEISNYVPNAYVEDWRKTMTISFRGISRTRPCGGKNFSKGCIDGVLDFDFNLINLDKFSLNPKVNMQSLSSRGTSIGEGISLGFKAAKKLSNKWSLALGGENIVHFDDTIDLGRNFYLVASTYKTLFKKKNGKDVLMFFNGGLGTDFYGYKGNGFLGKVNCFGKPNLTGNGTTSCSVGPIGSIAIAFNDRVALINEWFGYGYGSGISIKPFTNQSLSFSLYITDYISTFPVYLEESCPYAQCKTRFYSGLSVTF